MYGVAEARHEVDSSQDPAESTSSEHATMNVTTVDENESVVHIAFAARCDLRFEIAITRGDRRSIISRSRADGRTRKRVSGSAELVTTAVLVVSPNSEFRDRDPCARPDADRP